MAKVLPGADAAGLVAAAGVKSASDLEDAAVKSDPMSEDVDSDLEAAMNALAQDSAYLGGEGAEMSVAEQMAASGQSTAEVDGETVSMSQGAARRFSMFDKDGNGLFSAEEVEAIQEQIRKNNMTVGLKDDSDGAIRLDSEDGTRLDAFDSDTRKNAKDGEDYDSIQLGTDGRDGTITISSSNSNQNHYEGPLGSFDYNPNEFAIGYKTVYDSIGGESVSTEIPVLKYVGTKKKGNDITIPDGVTNLDYTFEGNSDLTSVPAIPDSVESMHATFKDCTSVENICTEGMSGYKEGFWSQIAPWHWGNGVDWQFGGADGVAVLPSNVKDISYCFENCTSLESGYELTLSDTKLENMDGYARKCSNLTTILDVSEARLLPVSAQTDAYDGINTKMIKSIGGIATEQTDENGIVQENGVLKFGDSYCGISMYANEDSIYASGKTETKPYTVDEKEHLDYVKALQDYRANDRMYLADPSAVANATAGMATTASYTDANGQTVYTTDPTKGDEVQTGSSSKSGGLLGGLAGNLLNSDIGKIAQHLGFGYLEYSVVKKFTKNPIVALGVTAGGQALGVLPGTLDGLGNTMVAIGGMLGEDSKFGGMLTKLGNTLQGTASAEAADTGVTKKDAANMNVITDATQAYEAQTNALSASALSKLNDNMANRGAYSAEYGTFQEMAEVQEGYGVFNNVRMASEDSMAAFSIALLEKQQADGGTLSEESKAELAQVSKQILQGWSTYGKEAYDALRETYGGNPEEQAKGEAGLAKTMRAAVTPDLEILKGLNEQYGFLSEQDIADLDTLSFKGLDGVTFSTYQAGANYAPEVDPYVQFTDEEGQRLEGVFDDYRPEAYDIEQFVKDAAAENDRQTRTNNYVSQFGDGSAFAEGQASGGTELGSDDITRRNQRVAALEAKGYGEQGQQAGSEGIDYE